MDTGMATVDAYRVLNVRPDAHAAVIRAAFHALAALNHPDVDRSPEADARMAELNRAYAEVRTPEARAEYDRRGGSAAVPDVVSPAPAAAPVASSDARPGSTHRDTVQPPPARRATGEISATIDFGRYDGWTLAELAKHDPDYLRWLNRHTSGLRYRREIGERLAASAATATVAPKTQARRGWSRLGL